MFWPGRTTRGDSGAARDASARTDSSSTRFYFGATRVVSGGTRIDSSADRVDYTATKDDSVATTDFFRPHLGKLCLIFLRPKRGVHGFLRPHHRNQNPKLGSENCFARAMMPANKSQKTSSRHENWYPKFIRNSVKQKKNPKK